MIEIQKETKEEMKPAFLRENRHMKRNLRFSSFRMSLAGIATQN